MPREVLSSPLRVSQRSFLESLPFPAFVQDRSGHYVACNGLFESLVGKPAGEIVGATVADLIAPGHADLCRNQSAEVWAQQLPTCHEMEVRRIDGVMRRVRIHRSILRSEADDVIEILGIVQDVTKEYAAIASLTASEERFARLAELSSEGMVLHAYGTIIDVNDALLRMVGRSRDEVVGQHYLSLLPAEEHGVVSLHVEERCSERYRVSLKRADGSTFPVEMRGNAISIDGQDIRVTTVTDISARIAAEQAMRERELLYRQMFENNRAVKLLIDPLNGQIVDANPAAAAFYGWTLDELRRMNIAQINALPPEQIKSEMDRARSESRLFFRFPHRTKHDEIKQVEVYSGPCTFHGRALLHSIIVDVTDRDRAVAELRDKTDALAQSNADLQQFAYVASHDLQEPLRSVVSYLQLLEKRYRGHLDEEADTFIRYAVDGAKRMGALIQDLLSYSRVDSQGGDFEPLDCDRVLSNSMANLHSLLGSLDAKVTIDHLPWVLGDGPQLSSVFQNLIGNAVKYRHRARAPEIHISAQPGQGGEWVFCVRDNGIGIGEEFQERIFGIFQRLHTQAAYPGTGIGLALVRRIINRHGGRIWVDSKEGEGCAFFFTLREAPPLERRAAAAS